jgi:hypothetical protein
VEAGLIGYDYNTTINTVNSYINYITQNSNNKVIQGTRRVKRADLLSTAVKPKQIRQQEYIFVKPKEKDRNFLLSKVRSEKYNKELRIDNRVDKQRFNDILERVKQNITSELSSRSNLEHEELYEYLLSHLDNIEKIDIDKLNQNLKSGNMGKDAAYKLQHLVELYELIRSTYNDRAHVDRTILSNILRKLNNTKRQLLRKEVGLVKASDRGAEYNALREDQDILNFLEKYTPLLPILNEYRIEPNSGDLKTNIKLNELKKLLQEYNVESSISRLANI